MAHPLRIQHEDQTYYVANYCIQQAYLFLPREEVNEIIRGCLAWAKFNYGVRLHAFVFLLNEYGLMLSAPALNLPAFMRCFQGQLATALNKHYGREGKFFEGRYYKADLLGPAAILDCFNQITQAPVKTGLVRRVEDWPGVSSWQHFTRGENVQGRRLNRTEYRRLKRKSENKRQKFEMPKDAGMEDYEFELDRLPGFEKLSEAKYRENIENMVNDRMAELKKEHAKAGAEYMGTKKFKKLTWRDHPKEYARRGKRPIAMGPEELLRAHMDRYKAIAKAYAEAMRAYVQEWDASKFPTYTCPPGLIQCRVPRKFKAHDGPPALEGASGDEALRLTGTDLA